MLILGKVNYFESTIFEKKNSVTKVLIYINFLCVSPHSWIGAWPLQTMYMTKYQTLKDHLRKATVMLKKDQKGQNASEVSPVISDHRG